MLLSFYSLAESSGQCITNEDESGDISTLILFVYKMSSGKCHFSSIKCTILVFYIIALLFYALSFHTFMQEE